MCNIRKSITNFIVDIYNYAMTSNRQNFLLQEKIDEDGVFFLFHNDEELDDSEEFQKYAFEKVNEHLTSNNIRSFCFTYDFRFADEVGEAWGVQNLIEHLTFNASAKIYPLKLETTTDKQKLFKSLDSPKTSFKAEINTEIGSVAS